MNAVKIGVLEPHPLVDLDRSSRSLSLRIDPNVPDAFTVAEHDGVTAVPVSQWHTSLTNGFNSGPGSFFQNIFRNDLKKSEGSALLGAVKSDYELSLVAVNLDYVPTAVFSRGVQVVGAASVVARIRYIARLTDKSGVVVARAQGEVLSTSQWTAPGGSPTTCNEALEAMYVDITRKMLAKAV